MRALSIDIETFSDVDLSKCGVYRYSQSPAFEILLFGYAVDGGEVKVIDLACGEKIPADIIAALSDESVTKWAFNAMFERVCLSNYLGEWLEPEGWHCTMVWSATLGLPLSLEGVGAVLGLEKQKLTEGKDLIRYFCVPCKPTKTNGDRTRNLPEHDREKWERFKAYNLRDVETEMQIQQRLSKFPVPGSIWEEYHLDQKINDRGIGVDMELVRQAIAMDERSKADLSSAMQELTNLENPNSVQQMKQWLAENGLETDTLFVPQDGRKFIVADFSAIEARVIAWFAGEQWRLKVFEDGGDIYCASASQMFHVPVEKHGVNGHLRQKGKIAELALGYGGSVGALKSMGALEMGLAEDELQPLVDAWRNSNPMITQFWWDVDRTMKECIKKRLQTETHGVRFTYQSGMLFITLPSGRRLAYVKPRLGENCFGGESVTYMGVGGTKKWERLESYGPKFVENIVQATARDILCYAMQTLKHCAIVAHVHDEIIIEADRRMSLAAVCEQMGRTPPWAKGLKLRADGYECEFYQKD